MSLYPIQPSFAGGELAPSLWGRVDLAKYQVGLKTCENFVIHPHGGVSRRPGMRYIAAAKAKCRLVSFSYNAEQSYILEFGANYIRFFKDGAPILSGGAPYEVSTPYAASELDALGFTQSADVLFIVHGAHKPMELARYSDTNWKLAAFGFKDGPFKVKTDAQSAIKVGLSATSGSVTVTSSTALFQAGHVGSIWSVVHQVEDASVKGVPTSEGALRVTAYGSWRLETNGFWTGNFYLQRWDDDEDAWITMKTYASPNSKFSAKNYTDSGEVDEPTTLRLVSSDFTTFVPTDNVEADRGYVFLCANETMHRAYFKITAVASSTSATATMTTKAAKTASTVSWGEGAWSDVQGWPQAVGFYQERIVFGGTPKEPQTIWLSKTGDYYDFGMSSPIVDDDSISATLAARQVNPIRHFVGLESLVILTGGSEWLISGDGAITPTSINAKPQGYRGCDLLEPIVIGNMILFVQEQGYRVRDLGYSFETDNYTGTDLTVMASHLLRGYYIKDWCYQQEPDSMVWIVRSDGALLSLTYLREHDVIAWARHPTDGTVESIASISGDQGTDVYLSVLRNGTRCIEVMEPVPVTTPQEAFYVDSGATVRNASGTATITGLARLNGKKVAVLADGSYAGEFTVSSGAVTIPYAAKVIHVGLNYQSKICTLDLSTQRNDGTSLTRRARLVSAAVRVEKTRGLFVGVDEDHAEEAIDRTSEAYGDPTALRSDDIHLSLDSSYSSDGAGALLVETRLPLPASVLAIVPEVSFGG